jgi:hypothetical protein
VPLTGATQKAVLEVRPYRLVGGYFPLVEGGNEVDASTGGFILIATEAIGGAVLGAEPAEDALVGE